ncbi:MAG: EAL domain-containing protein [Pirellulales bacterium]
MAARIAWCSELYISVNVSTKQFAEPNFVEIVKDCLKSTGLDSRTLKLEITESAIVTDPNIASATIDRLRALGISISLDDFGTGYSSLSYLQNFKIDTLKIDRSFISRIGSSHDSEEIVRTIIALAHNLGIEVVAEGIEDDGQHDHLRMLGCESGQGYRYSRRTFSRGRR